MYKQRGFTLIELVVVMVILGILAAFAVSKFYNFGPQARAADVNGLAGAITSAYVTAHGAALAQGVTSGTISMEGSNVAILNGYPDSTAGGIGNAISISSAFSVTAGGTTGTTITYSYTTATTPANCSVRYTAATSSVPASVLVTTSGC